MLVWRATVDPIRNIGEPFNAHWVYPEGKPDPELLSIFHQFEIQQDVARIMVLSYNNPGSELPAVGWWTPGQPEEHVYVPDNAGDYGDFASHVVYHRRVPRGRGLNTQYIPPVRRQLMELGELEDDWINFLTQQLHGKGTKYIRNFIERSIVTPRFTDYHTPEYDKQLRNTIVKIFKQAATLPNDEAEEFVLHEWEHKIYPNPENAEDDEYDYNMLFLDPNLLTDDNDLGILYNKKGVRRVPANRAEIEKEFQDVQQYVLNIRQPPTPGTRRRRRQRKRDKKLLKEYYASMGKQGEAPGAVYDGGRRRKVTRKRKFTKRR
jgi:hypothetical protein